MSTPMPAAQPAYPHEEALLAGVRTRRSLAFLVDLVVISILTLVAAAVVFVLGIFTLGLGWLLFGILPATVALAYTAFTLGGPASATPGMRALGLEMRQDGGAPMNPGLAAIHAVLFYASVTLLTPFVLLVCLFTDRKRLAHDILLGTTVANRR